MSYKEVRERIALIITSWHSGVWYSEALKLADKILSDPDILVKAKDQKTPEPNLGKAIFGEANSGYKEGMMDMRDQMLKAGWIKAERKPVQE